MAGRELKHKESEESDASTAITSKLHDALCAGQHSLSLQRRSIGTGCLAVGMASYFVCCTMDSIYFPASRTQSIAMWTVLVQAFSYNVRFLGLGSAPLADDIRLTRLVVVLDIAFIVWEMYADQYVSSINSQASSLPIMGQIFTNALLIVCAILMLGQQSAMDMQRQLWNIVAVNRLLCASQHIVLTIWLVATKRQDALPDDRLNVHIIWAFSDIALFVLIVHPHALPRITAWFRWTFEVQRASHVASGIAGLIGNCSVSEALAQAKLRFRCISMEQLYFENLFGSTIAPDVSVDRPLFERTRKCSLGTCDAFLSHSWHDDANEKWRALQDWRADFVARRGREPRIWFDKACINQQCIHDDLLSLPIFLGGSKQLVILWGPSYLSRLWCVLEIFTFIHIGGGIDKITVLPVVGAVDAGDDITAIRQAYEKFDVQRCDCFFQRDKQRMLEIITTAFGDVTKFNNAVRKLLGDSALELSKILREGSAEKPNDSETTSDDSV